MDDDGPLRNDPASALWFDDTLPRWDEGDLEPAHKSWCPRPTPQVHSVGFRGEIRLDKVICPECLASYYLEDGQPVGAEATAAPDPTAEGDLPGGFTWSRIEARYRRLASEE